MNRIVKKLLLVAFLASSLPLFGQTFGEVDLERLIMNHPMMKNYDVKTGYFKNTPYDFKSVKDLKVENASITSEIERIEFDQSKNAFKIFEDTELDEDILWSDIASLDKKKYLLKYKKSKNDNLIMSEGKPGTEKLYPIVDNMCNDIFVPLYNKNKVILNKLPRYLSKKPDLEGNDFHTFWFNPSEKVLCSYLQYASFIALIFPSADKTILFQKPSGDNK
ncbi:MAG: hypothetical protein II567_02595 [Candidatus Riflebacteria bacterium]|nr:hypothetical protein [Candidatus Riflebacteria bacterium]